MSVGLSWALPQALASDIILPRLIIRIGSYSEIRPSSERSPEVTSFLRRVCRDP